MVPKSVVRVMTGFSLVTRILQATQPAVKRCAKRVFEAAQRRPALQKVPGAWLCALGWWDVRRPFAGPICALGQSVYH